MKSTRRGFLKMIAATAVAVTLLDPRGLINASAHSSIRTSEIIREWLDANYAEMFTSHNPIFTKLLAQRKMDSWSGIIGVA